MNRTVTVVGLGYIGLPTAVVLANSGLKVFGVDVLPEKVSAINIGLSPINEPGLADELVRALATGRFEASSEMPESEVFIIAVPTPFGENHEIDNQYLLSAVESIAPKLNGGELIILESTSAPGTTNLLGQQISRVRPDLCVDGIDRDDSRPCIYVAHCPERVLPGSTLRELRTNDRVIGGLSPEATSRAREVYSSFCTGKLLSTDAKTAEMTKLTENSFRDVNIAFANELSLICDEHGIDVWELIKLANHHPRVNILQPGPGVGGHCIAVDPWFIVSSSPESSRLIRTAREVNDAKPKWVVNKIKDAVAENSSGAIAILGLAFKPNIDDLRESPAVEICEAVAEAFPSHRVLAVEPHVSELPFHLQIKSNVELCELGAALSHASVAALLVDHDKFQSLSLTSLDGISVIDTRGVIA